MRPLKSPQNFHFDWSLWCKVYNVWPKKVQRNYLPWHWSAMQNLKKNRLVVRKMIWGIWEIFTWTFKSIKSGTLMGYFCRKYVMFEVKNYRGVIFNDTGEWWKIWSGIDLLVQNWNEDFNIFWLEHSKIPKLYPLMCYAWPKYIMFEHRKYRGVMFDGTKDWCKIWRKTGLRLQKLHDLHKNLANFDQSTQKSKNWDFDGILLSKVENVWTYNLQGFYVSWQWKMIQNLKKNWLSFQNLHKEFDKFWHKALENLKTLQLNGLLNWPKYIMFEQKATDESCLMALNTDAKFEGKLTVAFKNNMKNFANFILESKMA